MSKHKGERVRLTVRLPKETFEGLIKIAAGAKKDVNTLICKMVEECVG